MNWRDVPIPARMANLPKDRRGYPIPVIVARDRAGEPLFTVNDSRATARQRAAGTCGICGGEIPLGEFIFIGGPVSAFHPHGAYIDGPTHAECATYALMVCPYLAAPRYTGRLDWKPALKNGIDADILVDPTMLPDRPPCFVAIQATSYNVILNTLNFVPVGEFGHSPDHPSSRMLGYQVWQFGKLVEDKELAARLIQEGFEALQTQERQAPKVQPVAQLDD